MTRLIRLKIKYENLFNEKQNIYNNIIEKTIGNIKGDIINDIENSYSVKFKIME